VIFAENEKWKWNETSHSEDLETEDSENLNDVDDRSEEPVTEAVCDLDNDQVLTEGQAEEHIGTSTSNLNQGRARRPPAWLSDFDTSAIDDDEESINLVMFGPCVSKDPLTFEEAAKSQIWRKAMKDEIDSIERNKT
jgi:hypothetical protein